MNALGWSGEVQHLCVFVHSIILLYGRRISTSASGSDWSNFPQPVSVWSQSPAHHWWDTCLGRGGKATRLCPGKMALEEQCSAPPRWRSISLTHVEFPEGTYTSFDSRDCRVSVRQRQPSNSRRACFQATEWTPGHIAKLRDALRSRSTAGIVTRAAKLWDGAACAVGVNVHNEG